MSASQRFSFSIPWLNRLVLWLSLFGMILAVHLWIQKARGFDQGCLGLSKHAEVLDSGCHEVNDLSASHLFGVSNAAWGYAFYFALALIAFTRLFASPPWRRWLLIGSAILVTGGFLYSGYLVFEMGAVAHSWCALCLISATTVTFLFLAHGGLLLGCRGDLATLGEPRSELPMAIGSLLAATGLFVGVVVFVDRLGTRPLDQGSTRQELTQIIGNTLPQYIDEAKLLEMRACHFDWDAPTLDQQKYIGPTTPFIGKPDGIPVIVFFDPNCPHCREYLPVFLKVVEKYKDRMRFTMRPRVLWDASILQVEALKVAEPTGKYFEVWERMLGRARGPRRAMTIADIIALFRELGLDTSNLESRITAERASVLAEIDQARISGIDATPTVYIGGRKVWELNRSDDCMGTLIERMLKGIVSRAN